MPSHFTPAHLLIQVPVKGEKGDPGPPGEGGGGPHTHPEYEHAHPYAADPHTHAEFTHTHDYAASGHTHSYAAVVHEHDYADPGHTHDTTHNHDSAYSATGHTHDTTHNHDATYAPVHGHPYADASHGIHPDSATWTDLTDGGQTSLHTHAGSGAHPDLATHDALGLATQSELDAVAAAKADVHSHPYAATSHSHVDADIPAGIARDSEVTAAVSAHEGAANPHPTYETSAEVDARIATHAAAADPHTGYLKESDASWVDLTDGGQTTLHSHAGGGGSGDTVRVVTSNQANSTVTPAVVTELTAASLAAGTYVFKVWVVYQAAATTTGIEMFTNFTGTVSRFVSTWYTLTTGGAAATGVADQATTLTAQMLEGKGQRAKDVASGPQQGVDTANADQFSVIEGVMIATGSGDFQMKFRSEVAGSAVTIMPGTTLELRKVA